MPTRCDGHPIEHGPGRVRALDGKGQEKNLPAANAAE
jgi:hypothetical protein